VRTSVNRVFQTTARDIVAFLQGSHEKGEVRSDGSRHQ